MGHKSIGPEGKTSDDGHRADVYDGSKGEAHSHDVFHTAADGWTTHDYGRTADGTEYLNTDAYQGNVISGSSQYDD